SAPGNRTGADAGGIPTDQHPADAAPGNDDADGQCVETTAPSPPHGVHVCMVPSPDKPGHVVVLQFPYRGVTDEPQMTTTSPMRRSTPYHAHTPTASHIVSNHTGAGIGRKRRAMR